MLFVDYVFELLPNGSIAFDKELSLESLNLKEDDEFVVKVVNEKVVFVKKGD